MTDSQVVLCGYYGEGNGGDEALLASMLEILPANVKPLVLSASPQETKDRYGVAAIPRKSLRVVSALRESQALILGGGSLLQDATSLRSPIYYGGLVGLAQQLGLKTIAIGQGIGPLNHPFTQWITQRAFAGCAAVSVRDVASGAILKNWGMSVPIAPDLVWNLTAAPQPAGQERSAIAITLRTHGQLTPARLQAITQALVQLQQATAAPVWIVPFQPSADLAIAEGLKSALPGVSKIVIEPDPKRLKGLFQGVKLAIGMRLHSVIMAAAEGCTTVAISYDPKVSQLMADLDLPGWELTDLPTDSQVLLKSWLSCFHQGQPLAVNKIAALQAQTNLHRDLLAAVL